MAAKKTNGNGAPKEPEIMSAPIDESEEDGSGYSIDAIADLTAEQLETMEMYLEGRSERPLGPNVACNGFFKKWTGAQLVGRVIQATTKQNQFKPEVEDEILFIQGIAEYPTDVMTKGGKIAIKKGRYKGTFGYQIDAGSMAISGSGRGVRLHLKVKDLVDLSGGRTRWTYDFVCVGG